MVKKEKNILILTSTYPRWRNDSTPGFVQEFATRIAKEVTRVYVLAPHYDRALPREVERGVYLKRFRYFAPATSETIAYNGGGVTKIKKTPLYAVKLLFFTISLFFNTLFFTLRYNVTIINAHWLIPQGFIGVLVKLLTGHTLVVTVHGADVLALNGPSMRRIKRFILRHADAVYVNSSMIEEICRSLCEREYLRIPMGVSMEKFQRGDPSRVKEKYQLNDFTLLFVGRLVEEKGILYFLEALSLFKQSGRAGKALIVGTGPVDVELKEYIAKHNLLDVVEMVGWVNQDELPDFYAAADVFVGPSLREAQGIVFIEALAAGVPVVTSDYGGMKDFVRNGENGFLVKRRNEKELFQVLVHLYDDRTLLEKISSHAARSIQKEYSWDSTISRYMEDWKKYLG